MTKTFDEFFGSRSRVTVVQFVGLVLIGGTLMAAGIFIIYDFLSKFPGINLRGANALLFLVPCVVFGPTIYLGILYIRRGFRGRH